jgi:hypothetical protein
LDSTTIRSDAVESISSGALMAARLYAAEPPENAIWNLV